MIKTCAVLSALFMFPGGLYASEEQSTSMTDFLQSVTSLYVASEECKHIAYLNAESYSTIMKTYLTRYYGEAVPYWALPEVKHDVANKQQCLNNLEENLAAYQVYSMQFAGEYPDQPAPPAVPELSGAQTYTPKYTVTAPVLTK